MLWLLLLSCGRSTPGEDSDANAPDDTDVLDSDSDTDVTDTDSDTDADTDTTEPFDCATLPALPRPFEVLEGLYASEDFCFDDEGHLISHYIDSLVKQEYPPGAVEPFAPTAGGPGGPASMRTLPTGDLVYANVDTSSLYLVTMEGGSTPVFGAFGYPTGIDIHPSGAVFAADIDGVIKIDPYLENVEVIIGAGVLRFPNGITFSEDFSTLYLGTMEGIFSVPVDADGTATAAPSLWASIPGNGEMLGMGVDACGNVYGLVDGTTLVRYPSVGGSPEIVMSVPPGAWMTNLQWGSGIGGWDDRKIYITDRQLTTPAYYEVDVGVPAKFYW